MPACADCILRLCLHTCTHTLAKKLSAPHWLGRHACIHMSSRACTAVVWALVCISVTMPASVTLTLFTFVLYTWDVCKNHPTPVDPLSAGLALATCVR